jgi:hypothetical protein
MKRLTIVALSALMSVNAFALFSETELEQHARDGG